MTTVEASGRRLEDQHQHRWRRFKSGAMSALAVLSAAAVILPLGFVLFHLLLQGASSVNVDFFTRTPAAPGSPGGGMANAIAGSAELLALATALGAPIGVLGAIYLSEYSSPAVAASIRFVADVLNGVPSIIWGVLVFGVVVVPMHGFSTLAGAVALAIMMIPLVLRTTEEVLLLVPGGYREAALALGIARWKIVVHIVVRTASRGIVTGVLLAVARISGETAPLLFTAFGNLNWNLGLTQPIAALPLQIYTYAVSPYEDWHRQAWAGALVLISLIFLLNLSVRFLTRAKRL
ncbi:phosphate ABC transporter permease PtsA [Opitutaceae bacterium EW11]|nr:phosphate ABC transporter permease PtsA [Opitutaceae bacterium EW11]